MAKSTGKKRLDEIEVHLTPKEWAIQLAKEMREYPCNADFSKATVRHEFRDWPWVKPFFRLAEQARASHPGKRPENIKQLVQQNQKLRTEFLALKKLIFKINEVTEHKAETIELKAALKVSILQTLIQKDAFKRTAKRAAACIGRQTKIEQNQTVLDELRAYTDVRLPSLTELLADDLVALATNVFAHETAVQITQETYFDAHPILFRDVEEKLLGAAKATTGAIEMFNEYLMTRSELFELNLNREDEVEIVEPEERAGHLVINLEAIRNRAALLANANNWMNYARTVATADILREKGTGEHEVYLSQVLRQR